MLDDEGMLDEEDEDMLDEDEDMLDEEDEDMLDEEGTIGTAFPLLSMVYVVVIVVV